MKHGTLKLLITGMVGLAQTVAAEPFTEDDINVAGLDQKLRKL